MAVGSPSDVGMGDEQPPGTASVANRPVSWRILVSCDDIVWGVARGPTGTVVTWFAAEFALTR